MNDGHVVVRDKVGIANSSFDKFTGNTDVFLIDRFGINMVAFTKSYFL